MPESNHKRLKRLDASFYTRQSYVHWTMTIEGRRTGWLSESFHKDFRQHLFQVCARYFLSTPVYCIMPDHFHLLWLGLNARADQLAGMAQLRRYLNQSLGRAPLQDQAYDHVLREQDRQADAFSEVAGYILRNPVRSGLAENWTDWSYSGTCFPGYPDLDPRKGYFWSNFWEAYGRQSLTP